VKLHGAGFRLIVWRQVSPVFLELEGFIVLLLGFRSRMVNKIKVLTLWHFHCSSAEPN
jgi:hypothetical protein